MSAIDAYTHAHVANFFKHPIYWIFEEGELSHLTGNADDDGININQYYLSIGGGSGEHPALIINNDGVIFRFLHNLNYVADDDIYEGKELDIQLAELCDNLDEKYDRFPEICNYHLDKNQWPLDSFVDLANNFKRELGETNNLERDIIDVLALFIIFEMPLEHCIKDSLIINIAKRIREYQYRKSFDIDIFSKKFVGFSGVLNNSKYGKIIRDNKVIWGYSLNDWMKDNL